MKLLGGPGSGASPSRCEGAREAALRRERLTCGPEDQTKPPGPRAREGLQSGGWACARAWVREGPAWTAFRGTEGHAGPGEGCPGQGRCLDAAQHWRDGLSTLQEFYLKSSVNDTSPW